MFAFALWDPRDGRLFIARDRFGIKPLYYATTPDGFYVASEVKALLPYVPRVETDIDGLHDYLSFQFCLGDKTMFAGIRQLRPAHFGWVERDGRLHTHQVLGSAIPPRLDARPKRGSSVKFAKRSTIRSGCIFAATWKLART